MKKIYIILFLLCSLLKVNAQETGLIFGISGGINGSSLNGQNLDSLSTGGAPKSLTGQTIGITLDNKISKYFGLKHEVFYSRKLMSLQLNDTLNGDYKSKFKREYIELFPVSPSFYYKGIQLFAGPYIGILLNASLQRKDANGNLYTDTSLYGNGTTPSKYSQKIDAGFTAGLNYEFSNGIRLGGRYIKGFVPLIENANTKPQWKIYNESFFITVGYTFKNP